MISWELLWIYNKIFTKCEIHHTLFTLKHLETNHNIKDIPDIKKLLFYGKEMENWGGKEWKIWRIESEHRLHQRIYSQIRRL